MSDILNGVFPVLATPFNEDGSPSEADLMAIVDYAVAAGVDGVTYPGVASEFEQLKDGEREHLVELVAKRLNGRAKLIVGASAPTPERSIELTRHAAKLGASAVMVMAPAALKETQAVVDFYAAVGKEGGLPIMLQNAPAPAGAGHAVAVVQAVAAAVPQIEYIKEETMPCGQRITQLLTNAPTTLKGIFGGAGGRYITDELARGALGTMPAVELAEVHVALVAAWKKGDIAGARHLFMRMMPLLNFQAVFRMAMTKETLRRRAIIKQTGTRAPGPRLDAGDHAELGALLAEVDDLLSPRLAA